MGPRMTIWEIEPRLEIPENSEILAVIRELSAHSDVAEELVQSASGNASVSPYCPDRHGFAFMVLHLSNFRVIGVAYGQSELAYRIPRDRMDEAVKGGAVRAAMLPASLAAK